MSYIAKEAVVKHEARELKPFQRLTQQTQRILNVDMNHDNGNRSRERRQ